MDLLETIRKRIIFFDGGTGSLLQEAGLKPGQLPETFNILHPEVVVRLHRDYLRAGCDIIKTNTFGANRLKYNAQTEYGLREIVEAAMENAREAVRLEGGGLIALDLGPTGKLLKPLGELEFEDAVAIYREVVEIGAAGGADLILIETMSDSYELKAAVLAARENSALPVFATVIYDERGRLLTGGTPQSTIALLEGLGVDALGINCGLGPVEMKPIVEEYVRYASIPVIVNPNAGLPRSEGTRTVYDIDADAFAKTMAEIADLGANVVGGCCGTTPEHIKKTVELCREKAQRLPGKKRRTVITSYASAVEFGEDPVMIGERINPTGKSKLKQALRDRDLEYIMQEAVTQQENGAAVLDVNVGLPGIDEPAMMEEVVRQLQGITELPLQIDTSNPAAMERAMRIYNGKPLINSVNGKTESMEAVFPLMKRYGGVAVALTLDETGIPEDADGRLAIAEKIYKTAAEYGIGREDILIDALCLTVSADRKSALTTLETVRRVRKELGGRTILGVSNISFGLPQREWINAAFFTMAMYEGLNAAIINPNSAAMMRAYYSYRVLGGLDGQCGDYIEACGGLLARLNPAPAKAAPANAAAAGKKALAQGGAGGEAAVGDRAAECVSPAGEGTTEESSAARRLLTDAVLHGLKEQAREAAGLILEEWEPLDVVNLCMIPALDQVGKGFERGTVYLPQLLMSAEAAKAAFGVIREKLELLGQRREKKAKIVLATVKGDIHDIGKNIVKVLLENYGFEVIDLGRDVDPARIADETIRQRAPLVGLSALMTTTVPCMEETIRLVRRDAPWARIMVGGAVLTADYAASIGADAYCRDAMASVVYAQSATEDVGPIEGFIE